MRTVSQIQADLLRYRDAEQKILKNQSYAIKDRSLERASLSEVRKGIKELENELAAVSGSGTIRVRRAIFRDD